MKFSGYRFRRRAAASFFSAALFLAASSQNSSPQAPPSALSSPDWVKEAIVYEVYLRAFSEEGKIQNLESRLGELKSLGVNCLSLMPLHPAGRSGRKSAFGNPYLVRDYFGVALEQGTKDGLKRMIEEAHLLGIKVILEWVAAAASRDNPLLKSHPEWYKKNGAGEIESLSPDRGETARLDYERPELRDYMKKAMLTWLEESNADGFRCDSSGSVPLSFWEELRKELKKKRKDVLLSAEGGLPENHPAAFDLGDSPLLLDTMSDIVQGKADAASLAEALRAERERHPEGALPLRFLEKHDLPRSAARLAAAHKAAAVLLFTLEGVPLLYNGQEIGEERQSSLTEKETIDWKEGKKRGAALRKLYKRLAALRRKHPALSHGQQIQVLSSSERQIFAFIRTYREDALLTAVNLSSRPFQGTLEIPEIFRTSGGKFALKNLFDGAALTSAGGADAALALPPWGWQVWEPR